MSPSHTWPPYLRYNTHFVLSPSRRMARIHQRPSKTRPTHKPKSIPAELARAIPPILTAGTFHTPSPPEATARRQNRDSKNHHSPASHEQHCVAPSNTPYSHTPCAHLKRGRVASRFALRTAKYLSPSQNPKTQKSTRARAHPPPAHPPAACTTPVCTRPACVCTSHRPPGSARPVRKSTTPCGLVGSSTTRLSAWLLVLHTPRYPEDP